MAARALQPSRRQGQRSLHGARRQAAEQLQIQASKLAGDSVKRQGEVNAIFRQPFAIIESAWDGCLWGYRLMFGLGGPGYQQGLNAATTASNTGAGYGADASTVNAQLLPFLTRELNNPQGFTQQQTGSMLGAAEAGSGGATAGLNTEANLASARNRNSGGFSGALDAAARQQGKTLAQTSEGIAGQNANLQQQQQQNAAQGLQKMQGMDTDAQLKSMGLIPEDINASTKAYGTGDWASNLAQLSKGINAGAGIVGQVGGMFGL